jgi:hypothetical protein
MPVIDHPVHEKTKIDSTYRYGCFNRKGYAEGYRAPNRYQTSDGYTAVFKIEAKFIPFTMSRECITAKTGWAKNDPACQGCHWITGPR